MCNILELVTTILTSSLQIKNLIAFIKKQKKNDYLDLITVNLTFCVKTS